MELWLVGTVLLLVGVAIGFQLGAVYEHNLHRFEEEDYGTP